MSTEDVGGQKKIVNVVCERPLRTFFAFPIVQFTVKYSNILNFINSLNYQQRFRNKIFFNENLSKINHVRWITFWQNRKKEVLKSSSKRKCRQVRTNYTGIKNMCEQKMNLIQFPRRLNCRNTMNWNQFWSRVIGVFASSFLQF